MSDMAIFRQQPNLWHYFGSQIGISCMVIRRWKILSLLVTVVVLITHPLVQAVCPVDQIILNGTVHHAPRNAKVRIQLVYPKNMPGDAGEVTVEDGMFRFPLDFLTQSRGPIINGAFEKCNRRPRIVIATLADGDQEYDRVVLDVAKDFKMADTTTYILRSAVRLGAAH
jgi:hypothetical protein